MDTLRLLAELWSESEISLLAWSFPLIDLARWAKVARSLSGNIGLSIRYIHGTGENDDITAAYIGSGRSLNFLCGLAYRAAPKVQEGGRSSIFGLRRLIERLRSEVDLIFVELPYPVLLPLSGDNGFTTMPWVSQRLRLGPGGRDAMSLINGNREIRRHIGRKFLKEEVQWRVSRHPGAFRRFYYDMYVPYAKARYGPGASVAGFERAAMYFRKGFLLEVLLEGELVAASVEYICGGICYSKYWGVAGGRPDLLARKIGYASNLCTILNAEQLGCSAVDFGLSRPLLSDGVFRFKMKWGCEVMCDGRGYEGLWVGIGRAGAASSRFLSNNPFVWMNSRGQWCGMIVLSPHEKGSPEALCEARQMFSSPGLESLVVVSPAGFAACEGENIMSGPVAAIGDAIQMRLTS